MSTCHFCGDQLRDDGRLLNGAVNTCYAKCSECGHIGHEHYADGRCRGGVYEPEFIATTVCDCTGYFLVAS